MRIFRKPARFGLLALAMAFALQSCATNHLIRWSEGQTSLYEQPYEVATPYVRPAGLILGLPITAVWDVATFPFQWFWDVYPYGPEAKPDENVAGR